MWRYVARRLVFTAITAVGIVVLVFTLMQLVPGTVVDQLVDLQGGQDPERVAELEAFFGLDRPWYAQLAGWLGSLLTGDLGTSWRTGVPVAALIGPRVAVTLQLAFMATLLSVVVGVPGGVLAAMFHRRWPDALARVVSLTGLSVPVFWTGTMLILVFSLWFGWSPPLRWVSPLVDPWQNLSMMGLPALALGTVGAAVIVRMTRNTLLEVLGENYIRTARSKGASQRRVWIRHGLRNALIPVVTVAGLQLGYLLGGAVIVEEVFSLPGVGRLLLQGIARRDFPIVQASVLVIGLLFMLINLVVDVLYTYLDPRLKLR